MGKCDGGVCRRPPAILRSGATKRLCTSIRGMACSCGIVAVVLLSLGCSSTTEPPGSSGAQQFTLVQYNGEPLPYSGTYQSGPGGEDRPTHCYEVHSGTLTLGTISYGVRVDGRENQFCDTDWTDKVIHQAEADYTAHGDSIAFRTAPGFGMATGRIVGDTVIVTKKWVPAAAGMGVRTMHFVER